jgi:hypothetical protein
MMCEVLKDPEGIRAIHGKEGREVSGMLHDAIVALLQRPEEYRDLDSPNGWGTVETTRTFIQKIWGMSIRHPLGIFHVEC